MQNQLLSGSPTTHVSACSKFRIASEQGWSLLFLSMCVAAILTKLLLALTETRQIASRCITRPLHAEWDGPVPDIDQPPRVRTLVTVLI